MSLPLALVLRAYQPTLDDHLDNLLLLGIGFFIIIFAFIACALLFDGFSKAFEASADWLEHKSARRRRKRAVLRKHYPPLRVIDSRSGRSDTSLLAHDALRRSAEAAHKAEQSPARSKGSLRAVKPRELKRH